VLHEDAIIVIVIDNKNNIFFIDDVFNLVKYKKKILKTYTEKHRVEAVLKVNFNRKVISLKV